MRISEHLLAASTCTFSVSLLINDLQEETVPPFVVLEMFQTLPEHRYEHMCREFPGPSAEKLAVIS